MKVDLAQNYNSYLVAYLKVHNIKDGDEVLFHDYSHWITGKHNEFRHIKGCPYYNGYPPGIQEEFNKFILGEMDL